MRCTSVATPHARASVARSSDGSVLFGPEFTHLILPGSSRFQEGLAGADYPETVQSLRPLPLAAASADWWGDRTFSEWLDAIAWRAAAIALVFVAALVVWLIGRQVIKVLTRSIETGLPLSRKARKALARARISLPDETAQEQRLVTERRRQRAGTIRAVLNSTLATVLLAVAVLTALELVGLPVAPLLASAGIVGVALGFGAQSLVKDLLSGVFMLAEDQYGVGDIVDLGEANGSVEEVGLRVTRLRSLNGTVWYVPNGEIRRVGNLTKLYSRALVEVRLAYDTDIEKARAAMIDAVAAARAADPDVDTAILAEPEVPGIEAFDYDAVLVRLIIPVTPSTQWTVMRAVRVHMREIFAARGISMAVPDHTLYLDQSHPANIGPQGGESTT